MFNANNARTKSDTELEELTDAIAAEFEDRTQGMTTQEKKAFASNLLDLLGNGNAVSAFTAGTYAQNSAGQPAQALGAGTGSQPTSMTSSEALQVIAADPRFAGVTTMLQRAALGIQSPGNPGAVEFDANGDDKRIAQLRQQLSDVETERNNAETAKTNAEQKLAEEKDVAKAGSLANQLAAAQATPVTPADMVAKADIKTKAEAALAKVQAVKHSPLKGGATSKTEAEAAVQGIIDEVS